ncbi:hypothetical protein VTO42DRAFT_4144 [Malbranchea cinnamomea]
MAIDPPSDTEPQLVFSPSGFSDKTCLECHWQSIDTITSSNMACTTPTSLQACFDINCWGNGTLDHRPSHSTCSRDVACCEAEDCTIPCTTVCDGFVDCDKSTACSDARCEQVACTEPDCRDTATACFDESCFADGHGGSLGQGNFDHLSPNDSCVLWGSTTGFISSCHSNHASCTFSTHDFGDEAQQSVEKPFTVSPTTQTTPVTVKSAGHQHHNSHCPYGKHFHVFDRTICPSDSNIISGNLLQCSLNHTQICMDSCNQQCTLNLAPANCTISSHLGFVPWSNSPICTSRDHQHPPNSVKVPGTQFCHVHHHTAHVQTPSIHTPALSITSSPMLSPIGQEPTVSSTFTTTETPSAAEEEAHICKWVHDNDGILKSCGATFPDAAKLQEHLIACHSDALKGAHGHGYYCRWKGCHRPDEPFSQKSKLQGHFLTHSNFKNFRCSVCGKSFARQATLERHERSHRGEKPYKCKVCGKAFTDSSELKTHSRTHTGEKPFKCTFPGCTFETGDSSNMSSHKLTHGERKHKCPHPGCSKSFTRPDQLKRHLKSTHRIGNLVPPARLSPVSTQRSSLTPS